MKRGGERKDYSDEDACGEEVRGVGGEVLTLEWNGEGMKGGARPSCDKVVHRVITWSICIRLLLKFVVTT